MAVGWAEVSSSSYEYGMEKEHWGDPGLDLDILIWNLKKADVVKHSHLWLHAFVDSPINYEFRCFSHTHLLAGLLANCHIFSTDKHTEELINFKCSTLIGYHFCPTSCPTFARSALIKCWWLIMNAQVQKAHIGVMVSPYLLPYDVYSVYSVMLCSVQLSRLATVTTKNTYMHRQLNG